MHAAPPIFVITGQLSAGKSTVAKVLLESFSFGYHVDLDGMREMVTTGLASPLERVMREIDADLERGGSGEGWHDIDNSDEPVEATVARILALRH